MKKDFSNKWKSSKQPRKQRKYSYNAPIHTKRKSLAVRLSKELTTKHNMRNIPVKTGDKVKIVRGQFKGKEGKVERVDVSATKVFVTGIERAKIDGSKSLYPIHPSNLILQDVIMEDKKRRKKTARKSKEESK